MFPCERRSDMTSNTLPRFTRTHTVMRFTVEAFVTRCGWYLQCKRSSPRTMSAMVTLSKEIEESSSDIIGYGKVSHPMTSSRDEVWRAVLSFVSRPAECPLPGEVDALDSHEQGVDDNIRVNEGAQEITFRSVKGGVEGTKERVLSLRTVPLGCEIHCRKMSNEMRVNWKAPRVAVMQVFDCIGKAAANTK